MSRALTTATIHRAAVRRRRARTLVTALVAAAATIVAPAAYGASGTTDLQGAPAAVSHPAAGQASARAANATKPTSPAAKAAAALPGVDDLTVSATTFNSVSLSWDLPAFGPALARVEQIVVRRRAGGVAPATPTEGTLVARTTRDGVRATDGHLQPGTSYSYAVFTVGAAGSQPVRRTVTGMTLTNDQATGMSGRLTDAAGRPIAGADVFLDSRGDGGIVRTTSNASGRWAITGLVPGQWAVCFIPDVRHAPYHGSATGSLPECYDNTPFLYESAPPDPTWVTVRAGKITTRIDASLAVGSALAGRVLDPDGTAVPGVQVQIYGGDDYFDGPPFVTGDDGRFLVTSLAPGTYTACFSSDASTRGSSATGYQRRCEDVVLTAARRTTMAPVTLERGAAVGGTVLSRSGQPLSGVRVSANGATSFGFAVTDAHGRYRVTGLASGDYAVCFDTLHLSFTSDADTGYVPVCDHGRPYDPYATPDVALTAGKTVSVGARLAPGSGLTGRVTDSSGAPVSGVDVNVDSGTFDDGASCTDADGRYRLRGIPAGTHTVCFYSYGTGLLNECYRDAPDAASATPVRTRVGQFTTIDAALAIGAAVTGSVTDASGAPIPGVNVAVATSDFSFYASAQVDDTGHYRVDGLRAGTYSVRFDASFVTDGPPTGYVSENYDNLTDGSSTPVTVGTGQSVTANAVLAVGAEVHGVVTASDGRPVKDVNVFVDTQGSSGSSVNTADDGSYSARGIPPGVSTVCFYPSTFDPEAEPLSPECYDDVPSGGTPTPVSLESGQSREIDAALSSAPAVGGQVRGDDGHGIGNASLSLYDSLGNYVAGSSSAQDGTYLVAAPGPGEYGLCVESYGDQGPDGTGYIPECYDNQPYGAPGTPITVGDSGVVSGIDLTLAEGAAVSGHVSSDPAATFDYVGIAVSTPGFDGTSLGSGNPDAQGNYTVIGLPPGQAQVCFYPGPASDGTLYANQCYDGQPADGSTPTVVTLTAGVTTTGIDAVLKPS